MKLLRSNKIQVVVLAGFILFANVIGQLGVLAQEVESIEDEVDTQTTETKVIELEITKQAQEYPSKVVPLELKVTSEVDIDVLEISWEVPYGFTLETSEKTTTSIKRGEEKILEARVKPQREGEFTFVANAKSHRTEVLYFTSESIKMSFNENYELLPVSKEYLSSKRNYQIFQIFACTVGTLITISVVSFGVYKFKEWLDKD